MLCLRSKSGLAAATSVHGHLVTVLNATQWREPPVHGGSTENSASRLLATGSREDPQKNLDLESKKIPDGSKRFQMVPQTQTRLPLAQVIRQRVHKRASDLHRGGRTGLPGCRASRAVELLGLRRRVHPAYTNKLQHLPLSKYGQSIICISSCVNTFLK